MMLGCLNLLCFQHTKILDILVLIKDERPILGGNYSQYTLKLVTKAGEEGVFMGDDKSVTTHVFWVKAAISSSSISNDCSAILYW